MTAGFFFGEGALDKNAVRMLSMKEQQKKWSQQTSFGSASPSGSTRTGLF